MEGLPGIFVVEGLPRVFFMEDLPGIFIVEGLPDIFLSRIYRVYLFWRVDRIAVGEGLLGIFVVIVNSCRGGSTVYICCGGLTE